MGVKPSPGVLDGLYGVQLGRRPSPGDGGGGEEEEDDAAVGHLAGDGDDIFLLVLV